MSATVTSVSGKFLTFQLANEEYGLEILKVRELIGIMPFTTVPQTPDYVKGVINLRGKIIPVFDLRIKLGMPESEYTSETCIIVVGVGDGLVGIIVDTVSEVVDINESEIEPTPRFGKHIETKYILGIGIKDSKAKILLDIEQVLSDEDLETAANLSEGLPDEN
jgi:purine-binding chemotaxis protein CheW